MGYQKLQVGRATEMDNKLSDTENCVNLNDVRIPSFACDAASSGATVVSQVANTFINAAGTPLVEVGDLVYRDNGLDIATRIVGIVDDTTITVGSSSVSYGASSTLTVLSQSTEPAVLYVGTVATTGSPTLKIRTMGGDDVTFHNPVQGSFLPVQTKRIFVTGTVGVSNVLALF